MFAQLSYAAELRSLVGRNVLVSCLILSKMTEGVLKDVDDLDVFTIVDENGEEHDFNWVDCEVLLDVSR